MYCFSDVIVLSESVPSKSGEVDGSSELVVDLVQDQPAPVVTIPVSSSNHESLIRNQISVGSSQEESVAVVGELNIIDGLNVGVSRGNDSTWLEYSTLMGTTLPSKSKAIYLKAYSELETYLKNENQFIVGVMPSEHAIMNYFHFLKNVRRLAPSTIWYFFVCNIT